MKFTDPIEKCEFSTIKNWYENNSQKTIRNDGSYSIHHASPLYHAIGWLIKYVENAPIMPEHPSDELLLAMFNAWDRTNNRGEGKYAKLSDWQDKGYHAEYSALRAALSTPPKPKMKTVWYFSAKLDGMSRVYDHDSEENAIQNHANPLRSIARGETIWSHVSPIWSEEVEDK